MGGFARERHEFVGMLRIKNEEPWIAEVLESILPLCTRVFVMDDHSTDATAEVCRRYGRVTVLPSPFIGLDESRDKNWLYGEIIRACAPEWILCIDGDEVLERRGPEIIRQHCADIFSSRWDMVGRDNPSQAFKLKIVYLWDGRDIARVDRIYDDFWRPSLFRPFHEEPDVPDSRKLLEEFRFMATPFGRTVDGAAPNFHCSSIPQRLLHQAKLCPARLKHYGYMTRAARVAKLDFYTSKDWKNESEDCYRHMCQGDGVEPDELPRVMNMMDRGILDAGDVRHICHVLPHERLLHAGPLELRTFIEDEPWEPSEWARRQG